MRGEDEHGKKVAGNQDVSIYEIALTLRHFERLMEMTQKAHLLNSIGIARNR